MVEWIMMYASMVVLFSDKKNIFVIFIIHTMDDSALAYVFVNE